MPEKKRFRFYILWRGTTTEIKSDPRGWTEQSIGYSRADDFAVNTEYTTPLEFTLDGRTKLYEILNIDGIHADATLVIYRRDELFQFNQFYRYKLDFTTVNDDNYFFSIAGIEDSLYNSFEVYGEIDYTIDMPQSGDGLKILKYDGVVINKQNIIQIGFGDAGFASNQPDGALVYKNWLHMLRGKRAVRNYDADLSFVGDDGLPFTTATFKCLKAKRVEIELNITGTIFRDGRNNWETSSLFLCKHPTVYMATSYQVVEGTTISPFSTEIADNHDDVMFRYDEVRTINLDLEEGYYYTLVFRDGNVDANEWDGWHRDDVVSVEDGQEMFMSIKADAISDFDSGGDGTPMQCFTFEWLLTELINKIYSGGVLDFKPQGNAYYTDLVAFTNSINYVNKPVIVTNLKDVLKAMYVLNNYSINFNGNTLEVKDVNSLYNDEKRKTIEASEISIGADSNHVFNEIEVGVKTDEEKDDEQMITKPYCQTLTYIFEGSKIKKKLNLVCPFMLDMYQIEKYLTEVVNDPENSNDNKTMVFAAENVDGNEYKLYRTQGFTQFDGDNESAYNLPYSTKRILNKHLKYVSVGAPKTSGVEKQQIQEDFNPSWMTFYTPESSNVLFSTIQTNGADVFINRVKLSITKESNNTDYIRFSLFMFQTAEAKIFDDDGFPVENEYQKKIFEFDGNIIEAKEYLFSIDIFNNIAPAIYDLLEVGDTLNYKSGTVTATYSSFFNSHQVPSSFYNVLILGDVIEIGQGGLTDEYTLTEKLPFNRIRTNPSLPTNDCFVFMNKDYVVSEKESTIFYKKVYTSPALPPTTIFLTFTDDISNTKVFLSDEFLTLPRAISSFEFRMYGHTTTPTQGATKIFGCELELDVLDNSTFLVTPLKYTSAQVKDSQCISRLEYELSPVTEQEDVPLQEIEPLFAPFTAKIKTDEQFSSLLLEEQDKYNYYEFIHKKTGKVYRGWINDITFAVGEPQSQEWTLQLKNI